MGLNLTVALNFLHLHVSPTVLRLTPLNKTLLELQLKKQGKEFQISLSDFLQGLLPSPCLYILDPSYLHHSHLEQILQGFKELSFQNQLK